MDPERAERRLAAILSADAVGYSRLMADDEVATLQTLKAHRDAMIARIRQRAGHVVDAVGDNLLAEFPSIVDAVACAVEVQQELETRNAELSNDRRMLFRIGLNLGDVIVEGDRVVGDGVNVAARLEALAEHGGICISGTAFDHVEGKLELDFEPLGEQSLKNIPKPVRVYRVLARRTLAASAGDERPARADLGVPGFAGQPAIAVLAFDNMSADPEQEYFADGIAEDLITRLSSCRSFPVIARNSSFVYKGKPVDVMRVSEELGARYIVEGSVRKAGNRVRISAQLIDGTTGQHVWAERFDRELEDLFALQDEITQTIAASINPELFVFEQERATRKAPENLDAWELTMRGNSHLFRHAKDDNAKARLSFEKAIELDSRSSRALAGLALSHVFAVFFRWTDSLEQSVAEAVRAAQASVSLDANSAEAHRASAMVHMILGERDAMISALEHAIRLDPSSAAAYFNLGLILAMANRSDDAIAALEKGARLSPRDPGMSFHDHAMGVAHFTARRFEEAAHWARRSIQNMPEWPYAHGILAASCAQLGRAEEARRAVEETLRLQPEVSLADIRQFFAAADPTMIDLYVEGQRAAGRTQ
jgi:TolB-like protein/Tfp pilus assembly protein PilF